MTSLELLEECLHHHQHLYTHHQHHLSNLLDLLTASGNTTSSKCSRSSTSSVMQTTSHRLQWTSRTSTIRFEEPIIKPDLNIEQVIAEYFRACPPHQNDHKIAYIVLYGNEYHYLDQQDRIQLTNIDPLLQAGYPNLYQHIHLHQQATDAINLKITSTLLLGAK